MHLQGDPVLYTCSLTWAYQGCVHGSLSDVHIAATEEKRLKACGPATRQSSDRHTGVSWRKEALQMTSALLTLGDASFVWRLVGGLLVLSYQD